jgi:hypothetical protein
MSKKKETQEETAEFRASKEIEAILNREGLALQPFLQFSEYGVVPRVRLVSNDSKESNQSKDNAKEGTNTEEAGGDKDTDESSKS